MSRPPLLDDDRARAAVLSVADARFYEHGIAAVSMADIRSDSGVALNRLYALYPSKGELVAAWLEDRHVRWMAWFETAVERHARRNGNALLATFDALRDWQRTPGYRGCAFLNTAAELSSIDESHLEIIRRHKHALIAYVSALAKAEGLSRPADVGREICVLLDGAIVQSAVLGSPRPITAARSAAEQLLASITTPKRAAPRRAAADRRSGRKAG